MARKKKSEIARSDQIASDISSRFQRAQAYQNNLFTKFNDYYRIYRGKLDGQKQSYAGRASLFVNFCYSTVETVLPRMVANKPKIEIGPRGGEDIESSRMMKKVLDYFWDVSGMRKKLKLWVKQMLLYGIGVVRTGWDFRPEDNLDRPKVELVDLYDFFVDPFASTLDDADFVIQSYMKDYEEVKKNPRYKNTEALAPETELDRNKELRTSISNLIARTPSDRKKVKLLDYWGKYDLNNDGIEEEAHIVVCNSKVLLEEENPYSHGKKPFVVITDNDLPNEFWPIGEIEPLESLQYELNDVRNQRMDNVTQILHKMWKVLKGADVDEDELVFRPNGIVHVGDMNGLEPVVTPDVTASSYNEESLIKGDFEKISGVTDVGSGMGSRYYSAAATTATGMAIAAEAGNQRFRYKLDNIEEGIKNLGTQLVALIQQYLTEDIAVRIVGEKGTTWTTVSPADIAGAFDITVEAGSTLPSNKIVERQEIREALGTVAPFAQFLANGQEIMRILIKKLFQSYEWPEADQLTNQGTQAPMAQPGANPLQTSPEIQGLVGKQLGGNPGFENVAKQPNETNVMPQV